MSKAQISFQYTVSPLIINTWQFRTSIMRIKVPSIWKSEKPFVAEFRVDDKMTEVLEELKNEYVVDKRSWEIICV